MHSSQMFAFVAKRWWKYKIAKNEKEKKGNEKVDRSDEISLRDLYVLVFCKILSECEMFCILELDCGYVYFYFPDLAPLGQIIPHLISLPKPHYNPCKDLLISVLCIIQAVEFKNIFASLW